jgi:predicted RNase H-like HicB family nuclease
MKVLLLMEKTSTGYSVYAPDVPGCVAAGPTPEETERLMVEALEFHLDGLRRSGSAAPAPATTQATWVEIPPRRSG